MRIWAYCNHFGVPVYICDTQMKAQVKIPKVQSSYVPLVFG